MPSAQYDLNFLQVGLVDIEGYLLSKELYWPVVASQPSGEPPYPRLTLGSLLLADARLTARQLPPEQASLYNQFHTRLEKAHSQWAVAWEQKAAREFSARLTLWRNFLEDYRENSEANIDRYDYEVNRRVMLQLLQPQAGSIQQAEIDLLRSMDSMLGAQPYP